MEILIKETPNETIVFEAIIYGKTERGWYIRDYCKHNKITYLDRPIIPDKSGLYCICSDRDDDTYYEIFSIKVQDNLENYELLRAMGAEMYRENLYTLMYIQRDINSPFHDINKKK